MSRGPRFFCEHCGAEVPRAAKRCASCGRLFASVKCPKCGFVGEERLFATGCPSCGYSAPSTARPANGSGSHGNERPSVPVGSLPFLIYIFAIGALVLVVLAALFVLR